MISLVEDAASAPLASRKNLIKEIAERNRGLDKTAASTSFTPGLDSHLGFADWAGERVGWQVTVEEEFDKLRGPVLETQVPSDLANEYN